MFISEITFLFDYPNPILPYVKVFLDTPIIHETTYRSVFFMEKKYQLQLTKTGSIVVAATGKKNIIYEFYETQYVKS